jgi:hypothetical protein
VPISSFECIMLTKLCRVIKFYISLGERNQPDNLNTARAIKKQCTTPSAPLRRSKRNTK